MPPSADLSDTGQPRRTKPRVALFIALSLTCLALGAANILIMLRDQGYLLPVGSLQLQSGDVLVWQGGNLTVKSVAAIKRLLESTPDRPTNLVVLDHRGGDVSQVQPLVELFQQVGLRHVHVLGRCYSACTWLLARMPSRSLDPNATICLHDIYPGSSTAAGDPAAGALRSAYQAQMLAAGFAQSDLDVAARLPRDQYHSLSAQELTACDLPGQSCPHLSEPPASVSALVRDASWRTNSGC